MKLDHVNSRIEQCDKHYPYDDFKEWMLKNKPYITWQYAVGVNTSGKWTYDWISILRDCKKNGIISEFIIDHEKDT